MNLNATIPLLLRNPAPPFAWRGRHRRGADRLPFVVTLFQRALDRRERRLLASGVRPPSAGLRLKVRAPGLLGTGR